MTKLTVNPNIVMNEPGRRRAYLSAGERKSWILIGCRVLCGRLENETRQQADCLTWHSYVASSIFCAVAIFSRQLFGYWKSTEYLGSPEYVCFPTVSSSSPFSPLFRRTHETCQANQMENENGINGLSSEVKKWNTEWGRERVFRTIKCSSGLPFYPAVN